jgi:hypothetical protein
MSLFECGVAGSARYVLFIHSTKRAAKHAYGDERGYQPVLALWSEQDVIVADECRDGNVPAGSGNRRVVEKAVAALPGKFDKIYVRGDSTLYEHELMSWMDERGIAYAISTDMSEQLKASILALPKDHWKLECHEVDAIRERPRSTTCPPTASSRRASRHRGAILLSNGGRS